MGLKQANAKYSCLWCNVEDKFRLNIRTRTARTIEALTSTHPTPSQEEERKGLINPPLLNISLQNVVVDELHLLLRITDVLTRNLIKAALSYDAQHNSEISGELERPMIKELLSCIRGCGVTFNVYLEDDGGFSFTSLVGGDKKKLLSKLPEKLLNCQPSTFCNTVKEIWEVRIWHIQYDTSTSCYKPLYAITLIRLE